MASQNQDLTVDLIARDRMTQPIKRIQSSIIRFVGAVSASLAAVRVTAFPIQQALEFDRALRDVQKTTGFTDNQIVKLGTDLNKLGTQLAVSQQDLAAIAAVGGQLGLGSEGVDAIRDFTESVARAQVTLGLTAEATAEVGAQLLNIFNIDVSQIENVFSTINELTNNSVANAADLADIMKRVGNIAGLNIEQVGALSAFARDLGITAEVAGTSYAKFFTNISTKAEDFAKVMQISTEEWLSLVEQDAVNALLSAADAINEMDNAAQAPAIKELFGGGRLFSFGSKLVNAASDDFERFYELLGLSNTAFADGTSSIEEYENILKSVQEQFNVVGNAVRGLAIEVGTTLLPDLERLATALRDFLTGEVGRDLFLELGKAFKDLAGGVEDLVTSLIESNIEWGKVLDTIGFIIKAIGVFLGLGLVKHLVLVIAGWVKIARAMTKNVQILRINTSEYLKYAYAARTANGAIVAGARRTQAALRASAAAATASAAAWSTLGGVITGIARLLGGWVGVLGTVATAVYVFWEDLAGAFSDGEEKLTEASKRKRRAQFRAIKEEARELTSIFESAVNRPGFREGDNSISSDAFLGQDPLEALNQDGLNAYSDAVAKLSDRFTFLVSAVKGADVTIAALGSQLVRNKVEIQDAEKAADGYRDKIERLTEIVNRSDNYTLQVGQYRQELEETELALSNVNEELEKRAKLNQELIDLQEAAEQQRARLAVEADSTAQRLVSSKAITKEAVKTIEAQRELLSVENQIAANKQEQERLQQRIASNAEGADAGTIAQRDRSIALNQELKTAEAEAQLLAISLQEAKIKTIELRGELTKPQVGVVAALSQADISTYDQLLATLEDYGDNIPTQKELNALFRERIVLAAKNKAEAQALLDKFVEYREPIQETLDAIDGMFDNISKTSNKTRKDLEKLGFALDDIIDKRRQEREVSKSQDRVDEALTKQEEAINKKYDDLIRREILFAQSSGRAVSSDYIQKLEERRAKELEVAQAAAETEKATIEADSARKAAADSIEKLSTLSNEYADIAKRIQALSENEDALASPEGAQQLTELTSRLREVKGELTEARKNAVGFVEDLGDIDAEAPRFVGDTTGALIISDDDIRRYSEQIKKITAGFAEVENASITALAAAGKGVGSALDGQQATLKNAVKAANDTLGSFIKNLPKEAADSINQVVAQFGEGFKSLPDGYLEAKAVLEANPINITSNLDELKESLKGENLFDEVARLAGEEAVEAIALQIQDLSDLDFTVPQSAVDQAIKDVNEKASKEKVEMDGLISFDPGVINESLKTGGPFSLPVDMEVTNEEELRRILTSGKAEGGYIDSPAFAGGGAVWGKGTSTSDSIFARLSRGEFVLKAAAVRKYGLNFLNRLNNMALPDLVPKFAFGGVVGEMVNNTVQSSTFGEPSERVAVDISAGGETSTLFGEREQVRTFVSSLKRMNKGS